MTNIKSFLPLLFSFILLNACTSNSQNLSGKSSNPSFEIVPDKENVLKNDSLLADFYEKLYQQKQNPSQIISIVHLGDSHIQQDMMTCVLRKSFQMEFGNAGRGLITPLKIAKTNEPFDYSCSSMQEWANRRLIQHIPSPIQVGIGGIGILSTQNHASISLKVSNRYGLEYSFDKVRLFRKQDKQSFGVLVKDSTGNLMRVADEIAYFPSSTYRCVIQNEGTSPTQNQAEWYGMSLEKNQGGVLYHAIGINGAKYRDYALENSVLSQLTALSPDLIIISLGTNEAQKSNLTYSSCYLQIDSMLQQVRAFHPKTPILLTTPAGSFRNNKSNTMIGMVSQAIIDYAKANACAYWDLYGASGGEESADRWRNSGLLGKDGVHYTQAGYETQGRICYAAFLKGFKLFVRLH